jgi:hypothetical protein
VSAGVEEAVVEWWEAARRARARRLRMRGVGAGIVCRSGALGALEGRLFHGTAVTVEIGAEIKI